MSNDMLNKQLFKAVEEDRIADITMLIRQGAEINASDMLGQSLLMYACMYRNKDIVRLLIDCGADVNQRDITGATPLIKTIMIQSIKDLGDERKLDTEVDIIKYLLDAGADIHARDNYGGNAVLHACSVNKGKILKCLLEKGADPNSRLKPVKINNYNDYTALMAACTAGYKEIVEILINAGADVNVIDSIDNTALWIAALNERPDIVQLLITAGAHDDDIHDEQSMKMAKMVAEHIGSLSEEEKQRYITDPNTSIRKLRIFLMIFAIIVSIFCLLGK